MTSEFDHLNPTDEDLQWQIDRLVDGELDRESQRRLLLDFESQPARWRALALTFLEQDALRGDLAEAMLPVASASTPMRMPSKAPNVPTSRTPWLALAASVLVAFGIGALVGGVWNDAPLPPPAGRLVEQGTAPTVPEATAAPKSVAGQPQSDAARSRVDRKSIDQEPVKEQPWKMVFTDEKDGQGQPIELPVYQVRHDLRDLANLPAAIPPEVATALERSGHRIDRHRKIVPLRLDDGRHLMIPMEQVELQFVGNQEFQ